MSHSLAISETPGRFEEFDKLSVKDGVVLDQGRGRAASGPNDSDLNDSGPNESDAKDSAEMTWLARKLMSSLVGNSITRALAAYLENQDIKGL